MGKTTVAKHLANEFGLRHVSGGDVLKEMARKQGFDSEGDDWWDTQEGMTFLRQRTSNPEFDKKLDDRLMTLFTGGGVSITSYTLPWLIQTHHDDVGDDDPNSADLVNGIKIWLDGSHASSAERMTIRDKMSSKDAFAVTKERFDRNKDLYKKIYGFDFGYNESIFDFAVYTDGITAQQVIDAAKQNVRRILCSHH